VGAFVLQWFGGKRRPFVWNEVPALLADVQLLDKGTVFFDILSAEIFEQGTPLADQLEEPEPRMMVRLKTVQVPRDMVDALGKERDLDLGAAGVLYVLSVFLDHFSFFNLR
jgi:hypothetical protein